MYLFRGRGHAELTFVNELNVAVRHTRGSTKNVLTTKFRFKNKHWRTHTSHERLQNEANITFEMPVVVPTNLPATLNRQHICLSA